MLVKVRVDAPSGTITLNRPEVHNALSQAMVAELSTALADLLQERKVRSVILTGSGTSFCSGTDLRELNGTFEQDSPFLIWHEQVLAVQQLIELMLRYPKPIIAAVHGAVMGTGLALALAADAIVAGESTRFQLPEARRGLNAGLTIPLLSFRTGNSTAASMLLFGRALTVSEARRLGFVQEIVQDELGWVKSNDLVQSAAQGARESHQMSKRMLNESLGESMFTLLSIAAADMASARTMDAAREGVAAFLEKRDPKWDAF
jgi:methylglutaconyl-CoA hydratase